VRNSGGEVQEVLIIASFWDNIRKLTSTNELPTGGIVKIVDSDGIEVTGISTPSVIIDRDFNRTGNPMQKLRLKEGIEVVKLPNGLQRVVGFPRTRRSPWLVVVGLPIEDRSKAIADAPIGGNAILAVELRCTRHFAFGSKAPIGWS